MRRSSLLPRMAILALPLALLLAAAVPPSVRAGSGPQLTIHSVGQPNGGGALYTIVVANLGDAPAASVHLQGTSAGGPPISGVSASQGSCTVLGGALSCDLGDVAPGTPAIITLSIGPGGSGALSVTASYGAGDAGMVSVSTSIAAVSTPPVSNGATIPVSAPPATTAQPNLTQTMLTPSCGGAVPTVGVVGLAGFGLLVSGGSGTPPSQCLAAGCSTVTLLLQAGMSTQDVVTAVEGTTIVGLWQYDDAAGRWRALFFAASGAPTDPAPLLAGIRQYEVCVRGPGSIVSH